MLLLVVALLIVRNRCMRDDDGVVEGDDSFLVELAAMLQLVRWIP